jgi:hypothetical protein
MWIDRFPKHKAEMTNSGMISAAIQYLLKIQKPTAGRSFLSQSDENESHSQPLLLPNGETGTYHQRSNLITALDPLTKQFRKQYHIMIG